MNEDVMARAAKIKLLLMDVDGVLTDGKLYFIPGTDNNMVEFKAFDSQDGIALQWCQWKGIRTGVISGRNSPATVERARQMKMTYVYQGHIEKIPIIEEIMADANVTQEEIAYIGDDLTDVVVFHRAGLAIAVANARPEVKQEAHWVTHNVGGSGAVRDAVELIFKARGFWDEILQKYEVSA
ncbi:MAG TPA: HAD hydrolase family protein [Bryobacteraceae bacterium]|nr:HAD hydrolase family protein [Bryobacteraceae bacterium]